MSVPNVVNPAPTPYRQISTAATTTIFSGPGEFYGISIITPGTGSAVTVYDNTAGSGTLLTPSAVATTAAQTAAIPIGIPGDGVACTTGLTVVTTGSPAAVLNVYYQAYIS
jgi:hypothetical protein